MKVRVRATIVLDVDVLGDDRDLAQFMIEENSCPGTGAVGSALEAAILQGHESGTCWACPDGKNEILTFEPAEPLPPNGAHAVATKTRVQVSGALFGRIIVDEEMPPDEARLVDPRTGKVLAIVRGLS